MKAETTAKHIKTVGPKPRTVPGWLLPSVTVGIFAADVVIAAFSFLIAFKFREGADILRDGAWAWSPEFVPYAGIFYAAVILRLAMLLYERVYRFQGAFSNVQEAIQIVKAVAGGSLLIVAWAFLFRGGLAFREFSYSRGVFILDFLIALLLYLVFHLSIRAVQTRFRNLGINLIPTLVVGTNPEAAQTVNVLADRRDLGYSVVGVVTNGRGKNESSAFFNGAPIVGDLDELSDLIRDLKIQEVIITDDSIRGDRLFEVMMQSGRAGRVEFRFAPSLIDLLPQKTKVEQIGVLPMVRLFREPLSETDRFIKRIADIVISTFAIAATSPLWLVSAILVRAGGPGPLFFSQERVGMDGRIFLCYKFRTMHENADDAVHREAYKKNIAGEHGNGKIFGKVENDQRITRFGSFLRRWSLDELPQLLNVLKGDMSIVGPRPPIPYEVEEYDIRHRRRLEMKPGLTGLWQVSGRSGVSFEDMVSLDVFYIENWSVLLDIKIILLTLPTVIRGDGAK